MNPTVLTFSYFFLGREWGFLKVICVKVLDSESPPSIWAASSCCRQYHLCYASHSSFVHVSHTPLSNSIAAHADDRRSQDKRTNCKTNIPFVILSWGSCSDSQSFPRQMEMMKGTAAICMLHENTQRLVPRKEPEGISCILVLVEHWVLVQESSKAAPRLWENESYWTRSRQIIAFCLSPAGVAACRCNKNTT